MKARAKSKGKLETSRRLTCPGCGAGMVRRGKHLVQQPHRKRCQAVAAEKARLEAVRKAWAGKQEALKLDASPASPPRTLRRRGEVLPDGPPALLPCLQLAVPLWVQRWRDEGRTLDEVMAEGPRVAGLMGFSGSALMWPVKGEKQAPKCPDGTPARERALGSAEMFNELARGIAALSFCPGGVDFAGGHWESKPEWLEGKP
jgi:hypothetical protein